MEPDDLTQAAADWAADINALTDLDDDQLDYLARVDELEDPLTDGIDCGDRGL